MTVATTPATGLEQAPRAGSLGIGSPRIPSELDGRAWYGLDEAEATVEGAFAARGDRDWRCLGGYEYEAVRGSITFYEGLAQPLGSGTALGYRHDVARKLGVYVGDVRLGRHGWEIKRNAKVRL